MNSKIQKWIMPVFGITIITVLFAIGAHYVINSTQKDVDKQNKQYLNELADQNAHTIKTAVDLELDNLSSIANIIGQQEVFSVESTIQLLNMEDSRGKFKRLGFISIDGQAMTTDDESFSALDREYFVKALQGESNVSDVMKDKIGMGYINVYAVPLYHDGTVEGVIFATCNTSVFSSVLNVSTFNGEGYSYIVKKDGTPVALGSDNKNMAAFDNMFDEMKKSGTDDASINRMQDNIDQNDSGIIEYKRDGIERVGAYCKLGINDWYEVSVVPRHVILEDSDRLVFRTRVSAFVIIFLLIVLVCIIVLQNHKNSQKLEVLAYTDPLTGGNNLNKFKSLTQQVVAQNQGDLYMVRIDIDNFKFINDMYGYAEGDEILLDMNRLISEMIRDHEVYGRIGNDDFLSVIKRGSEQEILEMGLQYRDAFKSLLKQKEKKYTVNFTTGVYRIPIGETDVEKMIDKATMAHRKAKMLLKERKFYIYNDEIRQEAVHIKNIEDVMSQALKKKEFVVYLQPKYNIFNGEIVGAEALVRWIRDGKVVPPAEFLPIFEKNGFIINIDMYVFEEVCKMQRAWLDQGIQPVPISVNQSRALVYGADYIDKLSAMVSTYSLPSRLIELELLETIIHENVGELKRLISLLSQQGFLICIDDFGTGYSSLNLLKDISADVLKIDREFLSSAESNERAEVVLEHMIHLAEGLHMSTVVEGVETENQAELLRRLRCSCAQGYLYARPMPKEEYEQKLINRKTD